MVVGDPRPGSWARVPAEELPVPDWARVFDEAPAPFLLLTPDFVIVHANRARLEATATTLAATVGRHLFDVFPLNPDDPAADGIANLGASLAEARDTRRPVTMAIQKYDIPLPDGTYQERFWSPRNVPVLDEEGRVVLLLHRSDDITGYVHGQDAARAAVQRGEHRVQQVEADLFSRTRELEQLNAELRRTGERERRTAESLAGLARTVSALATAETTEELCRLLFDHGRSALGTSAVPVLDQEEVVRAGGRLLGAWSVGWDEPRAFTDDDVQVLEAHAAQCAQAVDRVTRLEDERRRARATHSLAETLQRSLLTEPPQPDHLQIAVRYRPAAQEAQVGGDWYDAFLTPSGATTLVIGDVAGHDRAAAAVMGQLRNALRGIAHTLDASPAPVLSALDRALQGLDITTLVTSVLARVEQTPDQEPTGERTLHWSNAGHPPPLLLSADGSAQLLERPRDLLLGVDPGTPRTEHRLPLHPGDTVVLYTDGLVERRDSDLDAGLDRLRTAAAALAAEPADELADALLVRLAPEADDDVALLVLRVGPPG